MPKPGACAVRWVAAMPNLAINSEVAPKRLVATTRFSLLAVQTKKNPDDDSDSDSERMERRPAAAFQQTPTMRIPRCELLRMHLSDGDISRRMQSSKEEEDGCCANALLVSSGKRARRRPDHQPKCPQKRRRIHAFCVVLSQVSSCVG